MDGRYLLDTNILIAVLSSEEAAVNRIEDDAQFYISTIVLGEMLYGALHSKNVEQNLERLRTFADSIGFLVCDAQTSEHYGELKSSLRRQGTPIPENDLWIAASAVQHSLTLVSRDVHFDSIPDLELERW